MFHVILGVHCRLGGELLGQLTIRVRTRIHRDSWRVLDLPRITINVCLDYNSVTSVIPGVSDYDWYHIVKYKRFLVYTLKGAHQRNGVGCALSLLFLAILSGHV
jgi:hypothetical protein